MNKKIIYLIFSFLLLIPFRLPIAVIFINLISYIANLTGELPHNILRSNVIVTKTIYNIALSSISIFNIETLSRKILKRRSREFMYDKTAAYWWTFIIGILLLSYMIYDAISTHQLYNVLNLNL